MYSFHAASIRMIGAEGKFDFTNIHHYFTKTELFEAVSKQLYEEVITAFMEGMEGVERMPPKEGMEIFLDRMLDSLFETPDALKVLIQNMGQGEIDPNPPGFAFLTKYFDDLEKALLNLNTVFSFQAEVSMWLHGITTLLMSLIGAAAYHSKTLGMEPGSDEYKAWIKQIILYLFLPPLDRLFQQAREESNT